MRRVCVVHLVWGPLGLEPCRRFVDSYRRHPAALDHRLLIVFNGLLQPADADAYKILFEHVEHDQLLLPSPVQDIEAYFSAARLRDEDDICFLNSYCTIQQDGWLAKLHAPLHRDGVGIVGATGSWESMYTDHLLSPPRPARPWTPRSLYRRFLHLRAGTKLRPDFPSFPNPHLRTNAFMLERKRFLSLGFSPVRNKDNAHRFESSRHGLTARLLRAGLQVRVVGRDGHAWPPERWRESRTFRSGDQENLLVADNRTRDYEQADADARRVLTRFAWGEITDPT